MVLIDVNVYSGHIQVFRCDVIISLSERTQRRTGRKERKEER
jgi:hypothetical protein